MPIDVAMIMKLPDHNYIKTSLRYIHVTNRDMLQIVSPLDNLKPYGVVFAKDLGD